MHPALKWLIQFKRLRHRLELSGSYPQIMSMSEWNCQNSHWKLSSNRILSNRNCAVFICARYSKHNQEQYLVYVVNIRQAWLPGNVCFSVFASVIISNHFSDNIQASSQITKLVCFFFSRLSRFTCIWASFASLVFSIVPGCHVFNLPRHRPNPCSRRAWLNLPHGRKLSSRRGCVHGAFHSVHHYSRFWHRKAQVKILEL